MIRSQLIRREHVTLLTSIIAIFTLVTLIDKFVQANNLQQQNTYLQHADPNERPQLMVAIYCGGGQDSNGRSTSSSLFHNQYLDVETRKWRSDRDASAFCIQDKQVVLNYCRKVYPGHKISNIVESSRSYKIDNWCKLGNPKRRCRTRLTVKPYRCLEGTFQSDALLVPERCLFDHVHNKSICESSDHWNKTATENCNSKGMKLQSFAILQPCGLAVFSGVEFVCCPQGAQQSSKSKSKDINSDGSNSFAQAANGMLGWPKDSKYDMDEKFNSIKVDGEPVKKHHDSNDNDEQEYSDSEDDDDDEYDDDDDEYDDDSSSWAGDKSTTTTTTTTTTTERPVDHYLSHFNLAHEHDDYRKAELAVEGNYREKIDHVMKEWSQLDGHYKELKKKDPQEAEDFKKKMTHQFQKRIEALEEEGARQRHQLASMHAERAMAIINRRKKAAMDCLTQALDKMPIRTRQVEKCIVKLLKALEKDRTHTLRQYKNLLNLNTKDALREKNIILDHLVTLNRAANQSIAMLDRSPVLVERLKNKIVAFWHKLREIPLDEPIVRESELKIMEKFEEEVAQRKIENERQRLLEQEAVQDKPQELVTKQIETPKQQDDTNAKVTSDMPDVKAPSVQTTITNRLEPVEISSAKPQNLIVQSSNEGQQSASLQAEQHEAEKEAHYQIDSARFSHLKEDSSYHELSYSVKHDPIGGHMKFGYSTLLVSSCAVVIILAFIGVKYYGKHSSRAYRRQGFVEVGRSCPEKKNVTDMQFNGYENPAYKFFEAEA